MADQILPKLSPRTGLALKAGEASRFPRNRRISHGSQNQLHTSRHQKLFLKENELAQRMLTMMPPPALALLCKANGPGRIRYTAARRLHRCRWREGFQSMKKLVHRQEFVNCRLRQQCVLADAHPRTLPWPATSTTFSLIPVHFAMRASMLPRRCVASRMSRQLLQNLIRSFVSACPPCM